MKSVSIIIPVYHVSNYIERCIRSVIAQTYTDIECIIVDDATRDDSIEKCERLISGYDGPVQFLILHHNQNRGLSAARNTGTDAATGDYLYYLDGDDEIMPDCIEKLVSFAIADNSIEMVQGHGLRICEGEEMAAYRKYNDIIVSCNDDVRKHFLKFQTISVYVWNKLLKRSFVEHNKLYCREGIIAEDYLWTFNLIKVLNKVYLCGEITYRYNVREDSITCNSSYKKLGDSICIIFNEILSHLTVGKEREELHGYVYNFCKRYMTCVNDVPALKKTALLYLNKARQYNCWYDFTILSFVCIARVCFNPLNILESLNNIRWKVKTINV